MTDPIKLQGAQIAHSTTVEKIVLPQEARPEAAAHQAALAMARKVETEQRSVQKTEAAVQGKVERRMDGREQERRRREEERRRRKEEAEEEAKAGADRRSRVDVRV